MPRTTSDEILKEQWAQMIEKDITIQDIKDSLNERFKIRDFTDIVDVTMNREGRAQEEQRIRELEEYRAENPDIIQQMINDKKAKEEELEREIEREIQEEYKAENEKRAKEEEIQRQKDKELDDLYNKILADAEQLQKDDEEAQKKKEEQKAQEEAQKKQAEEAKLQAEERIKNDRNEHYAERSALLKKVDEDQHHEIFDLEKNKKYYLKDLELTDLSDQDLADFGNAYDSLYGNMPGDPELIFDNFYFHSLDPVGKYTVNEYVAQYINNHSEGKTEEEIKKMNDNSAALKKAVVVHSMTAMIHNLYFQVGNISEHHVGIPEMTSEQVSEYIEIINKGYKTPEEKAAEAEKKRQEEEERKKVEEENKKIEEAEAKKKAEEEVKKRAEESKKRAEEEKKAFKESFSYERNEVKNLWDKFNTYEQLKFNYLEEIYQAIMDMEKPIVENGMMDVYRPLKGAFNNIIQVCSDADKTPADVRKALKNGLDALKKFSSDISSKKFEGKDAVINSTNKLIKGLPDKIYMVGMAERNMSNEMLSFKENSSTQIKEQIESLAKSFDVELDEPGQHDYNNQISSMTYVAKAQKQIIQGINKQYKIKIDPKYYDEPDKLIPRKYTLNGYELAGDFVAKKYLSEMYSLNATKTGNYEKLKELSDKIKDGTFKKEINALSKDPVFKTVAKNHPNDFYTTWTKVQNDAENLREANSRNIELYGSKKVLSLYNTLEAMKIDDRYDFTSQFVVSQILADPNNVKTRQAVVAGMLDTDELKSTVEAYLKKTQLFDNTVAA